jgi:hypothetical protein
MIDLHLARAFPYDASANDIILIYVFITKRIDVRLAVTLSHASIDRSTLTEILINVKMA